MKFKLTILIFVMLCAHPVQIKSQVIMLPENAPYFLFNDRTDSVFIFAENLAVTAWGGNLSQLRYADARIEADSIPPSLKIMDPIGAIIYTPESCFQEIPVIHGRQDQTISLDKLIRNYFTGFTELKGLSEKGGIRIHVWQRTQQQVPFLIFRKNGEIFSRSEKNPDKIRSKNLLQFSLQKLQNTITDVAGVWIYPPEIGNNTITGLILKYLQQGPLLIEYWDGLSWRLLEECFLSDVIEGQIDRAHVGYSLFPPITERNYSAMISGGLVDIKDKMHIFDCLDSLQISYQILEGEKMIIPVQGTVKLHTGKTPEEKDQKIYQSTLSSINASQHALLFVHYHGLDDLTHSFGPYDTRIIEHFKKLWQWHQHYSLLWTGNMLIISDHGSHTITSEESAMKHHDSKGTHGRFIFEDMAVPVIHNLGQGKAPVDFKLSLDELQTIWSLLGTSNSMAANSLNNNIGLLEIIVKGSRKTINMSDHRFLGHDFQFNYTRKGAAFSGKFQGTELVKLLDQQDISSIRQVIASSYDGHQVIFSKDDLLNNLLVIGLDKTVGNVENFFTLYPLKDRFPNRMVKQLRKIEIE